MSGYYGYNGKKILILIIAALLGGGGGYLGGKLLIEKLNEGKEEEGEFIPYVPPPKVSYEDENGEVKTAKSQVNYEKFSKTSLEKLAGKYKSSSGEDPESIRIINDVEWEDAEYPKRSISYYMDGKCADEVGDIIPNFQELVGPNPHLHFGEESSDPDVVYFRNTTLRTDYELIRMAGTYDKEVLGIEEERQKPKAKPKPRTKKIVEDDEDQDVD